ADLGDVVGGGVAWEVEAGDVGETVEDVPAALGLHVPDAADLLSVGRQHLPAEPDQQPGDRVIVVALGHLAITPGWARDPRDQTREREPERARPLQRVLVSAAVGI